ncbi:MAG: response regulator transcription factor [Desulfobacteraceae bacterium]|jgi:two-component system response regulator CpxR
MNWMGQHLNGSIQNGKQQDKTMILLVDDDRKFCRLVKEYLFPMGFFVEIAHTGKEGLQKALDGKYQAIILDVMMPEMDGFELLKKIRQVSTVPILMLTAMGEETDRIVGLEMGADDYIPKTFSSREFLARLRAVIRRFNTSPTQKIHQNNTDTLSLGELQINLSSRKAQLDNRDLCLTTLEFDLLVIMVKSAGRVLTRDQLLNAVAGRSYDVFDRSVDVHISSLRKKLGDDPRHPEYIKTVRGVGYMFQIPDDQ